MGEAIAILSGKGGTGKTSVCAAVATALSQRDCKVLCIDCDVGLRNLDISLGLTAQPALSFLDICEERYTLDALAPHPQFPNLYFLTAPMNRSADEIDGDSFGELVLLARQRFDYVLLDAPAGVDAGFRLAAVKADRILPLFAMPPTPLKGWS